MAARARQQFALVRQTFGGRKYFDICRRFVALLLLLLLSRGGRCVFGTQRSSAPAQERRPRRFSLLLLGA